MTAPIERPATAEGLMVWVMHRFAEVFAQHAVLKGGMALRLYDCPRSTTDLDYVFVPYDSKKDVQSGIRRTLGELEGANVAIDLHSKMLRATVSIDGARIQVEANVARSCPSEPMSTGAFAASVGQPAQVVRVMSLSHALAHKLAAWNERRLHRDLYDVYFLRTRAGAKVDLPTLAERLSLVDSRLPALRKTGSMTLAAFAAALRLSAETLVRDEVEAELRPLLPGAELAGVTPRLRAAMIGLAESLVEADPAAS